jgi:hypothetical protein
MAVREVVNCLQQQQGKRINLGDELCGCDDGLFGAPVEEALQLGVGVAYRVVDHACQRSV